MEVKITIVDQDDQEIVVMHNGSPSSWKLQLVKTSFKDNVMSIVCRTDRKD